MNTARPSSGEVARWIANHLDANPLAMDTVEGIRRWWLAPRHGELAPEVVEQALRQLEEEGVVIRRSIGSQVVFGRAPGRPSSP